MDFSYPKNGNFMREIDLGVQVDFRIGRQDLRVCDIRIALSLILYCGLKAKVVAEKIEPRNDPDRGSRHPDGLIPVVIVLAKAFTRVYPRRCHCHPFEIGMMRRGRRRIFIDFIP